MSEVQDAEGLVRKESTPVAVDVQVIASCQAEAKDPAVAPEWRVDGLQLVRTRRLDQQRGGPPR